MVTRQRVDHPHPDAVGHRFRCRARRLVGGGQARGEGDADHGVGSGVGRFEERLSKAPGEGADVSGITGPVMTRSQNSLVDSSSRSTSSSSTEADGERDHPHAALLGRLGCQVTGAVGDHLDAGHRCSLVRSAGRRGRSGGPGRRVESATVVVLSPSRGRPPGRARGARSGRWGGRPAGGRRSGGGGAPAAGARGGRSEKRARTCRVGGGSSSTCGGRPGSSAGGRRRGRRGERRTNT